MEWLSNVYHYLRYLECQEKKIPIWFILLMQ